MMTELVADASPSEPSVATVREPRELHAEQLASQDSIRDSLIAIVDDDPYVIAVVRKHLQDAGYSRIVTTTDSNDAVRLILGENPDVILLDIVMPGISGLEILRLLRVERRILHTPILVLTATTDAATRRQALDLGATDFLCKPVDTNDLLPRIRNSLLNKMYFERLENRTEELEYLVQQRTAELALAQEEIVHCLARASEYRDDQTGQHVVRVGRYVGVIAREMGFPDAQVTLLELAAQLHDIGKIAVPDGILSKPGKLDPEEYALIQKHCALAKKIIQPMPEAESRAVRGHVRLGARLLHFRHSPLLMLAARVAQTHHEKWDGSGYPLGLSGEDIPIEGRMTAVADVYDALSTARPYKAALPREECFRIMREGRGKHFDPQVLDAFFARSDEIVKIQIDYLDLD